jgi:lipopolysaccharide biosynthesis regulator YciM
MVIQFWPFLLPAAAWSGWWVAHRQQHQRDSQCDNHISREYVQGLNYLLNEQPDKAVDVFIKLLEVDSDTVETHLALGSLFRRRGEVDRAIRIHQNLIARPQLSILERKEALLALGQDYLSAGLFDRAERVFIEAVDIGDRNETQSLRGLLAIYQQEKAWEKALDVIKKLEVVTQQSMHVESGHYYCEIAEQAVKKNQVDKAYQAIKLALQTDKGSVRANLIFADLEIKHQRFSAAIRALKQIPKQNPEYMQEMIERLVFCYEKLGHLDECINYLEELIIDHPRTSAIIVIAEQLKEQKSKDDAIDFVSSQLARYPSIRGLNQLIAWHLESASGKVREQLQMLYDITTKFLEKKPIYRCEQCGFSGKLLHWNCPSCKQWGRIKPINGLEGG